MSHHMPRRDAPPRRRALVRAALLLAVALATGLPAVAPPAHAASAIEQLRSFVRDTRSARGDFVQQTFRQSGQGAERTSGEFAFSRPGKFRWEVRKPFEQLMVADGKQLYFYDKDLEQVTIKSLSDAVGATPAAILFGDSDLERSFTLSEAGSRDGLDWLDAAPKSKEAGFDRIAIGLHDGLPGAMEVLDAFGRRTLFTFQNVERNPRIDPQAFRFDVPKGADVIRQ